MASAPTSIQAPKGTQDILPADAAKWQAVERVAREVATLYHFDEIRTPIFEHSELFHRGVGETTDIVSKETYTFNDRDNRSLTLRPEGTAGVVRAVIEAGLLNDQGARVKVFYLGPNFRYERPQKGRYRQHHQFGVEAFGVAEGDQDAECILLQMDFYRRAGLKDLALRINSLGDAESKQRYRDALVQFLAPKQDKLSADSQRRLGDNPLRILDSKDPRDLEAVQGAPPAAADRVLRAEPAGRHFPHDAGVVVESADECPVDAERHRGAFEQRPHAVEVRGARLGEVFGGGGRALYGLDVARVLRIEDPQRVIGQAALRVR